ncbi:PREDICTED: uncharacterized protein LOC104460949 [Pterocles gutturalis]|uniref:uncharacterized protein LOC104460949 n=1 Tax=Pterocles gutturalis TaxID=240206 RepID=UPI000528D130|nr:PREDICTED: uncharacterized protein LOC104460949 [Pterocles gutturalis]
MYKKPSDIGSQEAIMSGYGGETVGAVLKVEHVHHIMGLVYLATHWAISIFLACLYCVVVGAAGRLYDFDLYWEHSGRAFVRSDKPKLFRGLQIKYVRGSDPVLKLLDDSGNIAEELSILKWNTDSVEEFLSEKLERL